MITKQQIQVKQKTLDEAKRDLRELNQMNAEFNKILEEFEAINGEIHGASIEDEIKAL